MATSNSYTADLKEKHADLLSLLATPMTTQEAHAELVSKFQHKTDPATTQVHVRSLKGVNLIHRQKFGQKDYFCTDKKTLAEHIQAETRKADAPEVWRQKHADIIQHLAFCPMTTNELLPHVSVGVSALRNSLNKLASVGVISKSYKDGKAIYSAIAA